MFVFPLIFLLIALVSYAKRNHAMTLFGLTLIATGGFGLIAEADYPLQMADLLIMPILIITFVEYTKDRNYFSIKGDKLGKIVVWILGFTLFQYLRTVLLGADTPIWAFKVVRVQLIFLVVFYIRKQKPTVLEKYVKLLITFSTLQGVLYYLQLAGVTGILAQDYYDNSEIVRYTNYPWYMPFILVYYVVKKDINLATRIFMLLFWGMMAILSQTRGVIMGAAACVLMLVLIQRNYKSVVYLVAGMAVYAVLIAPVFESRTANDAHGSTSEDLQLMMSSGIVGLSQVQSNQVGSIAFRFGMLAERWVYLTDNPQYLPIGVGCIHEQSPNNHFYFNLGSVNAKFKYGRCMIESGDITWVPILLRHGLFGFIMYILLLVRWIVLGFKKYNNVSFPYAKTSCLIGVYLAITSLDGALFDSAMYLMSLCIYLGLMESGIYQEINAKRIKVTA